MSAHSWGSTNVHRFSLFLPSRFVCRSILLEESAHFLVLEPLVMTLHHIVLASGLLFVVVGGKLMMSAATLVNACL